MARMNPNPKPLWNVDQVAEYLGVARSTVHKLRVDDDTFPPAVRLSARAVRWRPEQVVEWTRRRQAAAARGRPSKPIRV